MCLSSGCGQPAGIDGDWGAQYMSDQRWDRGQTDRGEHSNAADTPLREAASEQAATRVDVLAGADTQRKNIGGEHSERAIPLNAGGPDDDMRDSSNPRKEHGDTDRETEPGYQDHKHERGTKMPH
jgi:hypothetical protein